MHHYAFTENILSRHHNVIIISEKEKNSCYAGFKGSTSGTLLLVNKNLATAQNCWALGLITSWHCRFDDNSMDIVGVLKRTRMHISNIVKVKHKQFINIMFIIMPIFTLTKYHSLTFLHLCDMGIHSNQLSHWLPNCLLKLF